MSHHFYTIGVEKAKEREKERDDTWEVQQKKKKDKFLSLSFALIFNDGKIKICCWCVELHRKKPYKLIIHTENNVKVSPT